MTNKPKNSKVLIIVSAVILVLAVILFIILTNENTKSFNNEIIDTVNNDLKNATIDTIEDLNVILPRTALGNMKKTDKYVWFNINTNELSLMSLAEAIAFGINSNPTTPEAIINDHWFIANLDDDFSNSIKRFRNINSLDDIKAALSTVDSEFYEPLTNLINSTLFITDAGNPLVFFIGDEIKYGISNQVSNVIFATNARTITASSFVFQDIQVTSLKSIIIPRTITSIQPNSFKNILALEKIACKNSALKLELDFEYPGLVTDNVKSASGIVNDNLTIHYTIRLFDVHNKLVSVDVVDSNTSIAHLHNVIHPATEVNDALEGYKHVGYMYNDGNGDVELTSLVADKDYDLYPNKYKTEHIKATIYNFTLKTYHADLNDAYQYSENTKSQLIILNDLTFSTDHTIPSNISVLLPLDNNDSTGEANGTKDSSRFLAGDEDRYLTLTVAFGVKLTVSGTLIIGGTLSFPMQYYQGHTSGPHSTVINDGTISVVGSLKVKGYVKGLGTVEVMEEGKVYQPFIVTDFAGGSNTVSLYLDNQSPFGRYTMVNVQTPLIIHDGGLMYGYCNLYASGEYNKTEAIVIGSKTNKGLISLSEKASATITLDFSRTIIDDLQNNLAGDLPHITIDLTNGATFDSMTMRILNRNISTETIDFPLPYNYTINLKSGNFAANAKYKLMPGATVIVGSDATLSTNDAFYVFDGLNDRIKSGKSYPTKEVLERFNYSKDADFIVNGKLIINGIFGGFIQSTANGATITVNSNKFDNNILYNGGVIDEMFGYANNCTARFLSAWIINDGQKEVLSPSTTYRSNANSSFINETFSYYNLETNKEIIKSEEQTDTVSEIIVGEFKK